jgi:hypothetical protein
VWQSRGSRLFFQISSRKEALRFFAAFYLVVALLPLYVVKEQGPVHEPAETFKQARSCRYVSL